MVSDRVLEGLRLTPQDVAGHEFAHGFRGYDVHEVRSFLRLVSGEMTRLGDDLRRLEARVAGGDDAAEPAGLTRAQLSELVGEEAAKVLAAAEVAAADIRARAEASVETMLRDARAEAAAIRTAADQRRADDIASSERAVGAARDAAAAIVSEAHVEAQSTRDRAVEEGRAMVAEAQDARERVLIELARKRRAMRRELAQLRAGIDELHESYDELRSMLDRSVAVIDGAVDDARRSAADAAERFDRGDPDDDLTAVRAVVEQPGSGAATPTGVQEPGDAAEPGAGSDPTEETQPDEHELGEVQVAETPSVAEVPTVADAASVRADERRTVHRRSPRAAPVDDARTRAAGEPVEPPDVTTGEIPAVDGAPSGGGTPIEPDDVSDVDADEPEADAAIDLTVEPDIDLTVDADELPALPELLDDGPVPPAPEPPPLFGRGDHDVDELFARIRASRDGARAEARAVLDGAHTEPDAAATTADSADAVASDEGAVANAAATNANGDGGGAVAPTSVMGRDAAHDDAGDDVAAFDRYDEAVDDRAAEAARLLKRALADQLNEVLETVRRVDEVTEVEQILTPDVGEIYGDAVADVLAATARLGAGDDTATVDVEAAIAQVNDQLGRTLVRRLAGFLPADDGLDQRVRGAFREWRRERAEGVARDAVALAYGIGLLSTLPPGTPVRWVQRPSGCKHADCADNALAGDVTAGEPFPTGHTVAPLAAGCRCLVLGPSR